MKKYIPVLFLLIFISPSIAFASWWNPFTWKVFKKGQNPQIQVEIQKTTEEKVNQSKEKFDNLQSSNYPITTPLVEIDKPVIKVNTVNPNSTKNNIKSTVIPVPNALGVNGLPECATSSAPWIRIVNARTGGEKLLGFVIGTENKKAYMYWDSCNIPINSTLKLVSSNETKIVPSNSNYFEYIPSLPDEGNGSLIAYKNNGEITTKDDIKFHITSASNNIMNSSTCDTTHGNYINPSNWPTYTDVKVGVPFTLNWTSCGIPNTASLAIRLKNDLIKNSGWKSSQSVTTLNDGVETFTIKDRVPSGWYNIVVSNKLTGASIGGFSIHIIE